MPRRQVRTEQRKVQARGIEDGRVIAAPDILQRIVIGQCSVSAILYGQQGPTVLAVNHTGDLVSLVPS